MTDDDDTPDTDPDGVTEDEAFEATDPLGALVDALTSADGLLVTSLVVMDWGSEVMVGDAGDAASGAPALGGLAPIGAGASVLGGALVARLSGTAGGGLVGLSGLAGSITEVLEARPTPIRALASSGSIGDP